MEITNTETFLAYYDRIRQRTKAVIDCIPPDKLDWTYRDGKFTFGDLIRYIAAIERYMFAETVSGNPSRYPGCGKELADGYQAVMAYFERMHEESVEIISLLSNEDLNKKCTTPGGSPITVWKWLRAMVEHEVHHRGQLYVYLGTLGLAGPPLYGLTAEEVRRRSDS